MMPKLGEWRSGTGRSLSSALPELATDTAKSVDAITHVLRTLCVCNRSPPRNPLPGILPNCPLP